MVGDTNSQPTASGSVRTQRVEGLIFETVYRGRITAAMADQVRREIEPLLVANPGMDWLINTTAATGFEAAPRESTTGVIETFRKHGGSRIAAVIPSTVIRMVATALVFATGLQLRIFDTRAAALAYLRG